MLERRLDHGSLGDRLGAHQPGPAAGRGAERGEEHEPLDAGPLGGLHKPPSGDAGELLDRSPGLITDHRGEVNDRVDAAQRMAEREVVAEIAERDLDLDPLGAEAAWIAHQAADRGADGDQPPQQRARPTVPVAPVRSSTCGRLPAAHGP